MRKLTVFNTVSLDGYIADANGDMSWAHKQDPEWNAFTAENAKGDAVLVFGRKTYDLMASFWPTPMAKQSLPDVAARMNSLQKIVFSRTMDKAEWSNTKLIKTDIVKAVRKLKSESGSDMVILGSGSVVAQLAQADLIDEFQVVVSNLVLGAGKTMFEGVNKRLSLKLTKSRIFKNGNVYLCYEPVARSS